VHLFAASTLKICALLDPQRDECIRDSIQNFQRSLRKPQDFISFPSMDPYFLEKVVYNYNIEGLVTGEIAIRNFKAFGMTHSNILKVKSEFNGTKMSLDIDVLIPKFFVTAYFKSNASFGIYDIVSKGQFNLTAKELHCPLRIKGELIKITGEDFMRINSVGLEPDYKDIKFSATGLSPDPATSQFFATTTTLCK